MGGREIRQYPQVTLPVKQRVVTEIAMENGSSSETHSSR